MNLEITPTKFDALCEHAEALEAENVRLEKLVRMYREALQTIKTNAGFYYNVTSDSQYHRLYQIAHMVLNVEA